MEVYVDDIILKSEKAAELPTDMQETFGKIRRVGMRLNPKKCVFGEVLGFMISERGIEVDPQENQGYPADATPEKH